MKAMPSSPRSRTSPNAYLRTAVIAVQILLIARNSASLSLRMATPSSPAIKRIAVIGTGIAGLTLAHALENGIQPVSNQETPEVSLFDSRSSLAVGSGAGLNLNGGMSVLRKINPELQATVARASLPVKQIRSRARPWVRKNVPFKTLLEINIEEAIRDVGGKTEEELIVDGEVMSYGIMRDALQDVLLKELPDSVAERIQLGKTLTGIRSHSWKKGIMCTFSDGTSKGPFDMVVGCDGVKSAVKEFVETGSISEDARNREGKSAVYSGIRIQYAIKDGDPSSAPADRPQSAELRQYFGKGAYALSGIYGAGEGNPPCRGAYLVFNDEDYIGPFKKETAKSSTVSENADWASEKLSKNDATARSLEIIRKASVPDIDVNTVLQDADRSFELGAYFHNPLSLSGWSKEVKSSGGGYCVLAGDSAHAMPPFLGQGANQAIQDSYCLASKIIEFNSNTKGLESDENTNTVTSLPWNTGKKSLKELLGEYEKQRWRPTADITFKSIFLGYLETGGSFIYILRDAVFFTLGKLGIAQKIFLDGATPKV